MSRVCHIQFLLPIIFRVIQYCVSCNHFLSLNWVSNLRNCIDFLTVSLHIICAFPGESLHLGCVCGRQQLSLLAESVRPKNNNPELRKLISQGLWAVLLTSKEKPTLANHLLKRGLFLCCAPTCWQKFDIFLFVAFWN